MMPKLELTEVGKEWMVEHYPPGIVWDYDPDKPFKILAVAAEFWEVTQDGIPLRVPHEYLRRSDTSAKVNE